MRTASARHTAIAAVSLACAALAAAPAAASAARGFTLGVATGDVSATTAMVWAHATRQSSAMLEVSRTRSFRHPFIRRIGLRSLASHDHTIQKTVRGLAPGHRYHFRFRTYRRHGRHLTITGTSATGTFTTAPGPRAARTVRFAVSGDADAQPKIGRHRPFWNGFQVYGQMASRHNDFNINLGDTIYSDTEVNPGPDAVTRRQKWAKYRMNLALRPLQRLRASAPVFAQWDDHEFLNDFSRYETFTPRLADGKPGHPISGKSLYTIGAAAFRDYWPTTHRSALGQYRTIRWGRNVELFILDERSFRSAKASANHVCDNPQTGDPDLAPTAPRATRALFSAIVPSLTAPVSPACLAKIDDPRRTMLGARQYAAFTRAIARSTATWKVIVNEVPIQQFYALPFDRWEGYAYERKRLLGFLHNHVRNAVFLTTDVHANLVNDARFQTLEPGGPKDSGILEVTTGPAATKSFSKEISDTVGNPGAGALVTTAFFKPRPPAGVGMRCAATDVFSYSEVTATSHTLTISPTDIHGRPVHEAKADGGKRCGPFVLRRR